jgi:hypothetical protein
MCEKLHDFHFFYALCLKSLLPGQDRNIIQVKEILCFMLKKNWLISSIALGIGMVIGGFGYALASTPVDGDSRLVSFWNKEAQPVTGTMQNSEENSDLTSEMSPDLQYPTDPLNPLDPGYPGSASGEGELTESEVATGTPPQNNAVADELAQKIVADYKQDIGLFFEAWKSPEMVSFRSKLAKAYKGDLYEKHARQAENFIVQGVGLEVSGIRFERVNVESATNTAATLTAQYSYVAQDYSIGEQAPVGEKTEHTVNVRVNLIKENSRWMITGETGIQ